MTLSAEKQLKHVGETKGAADHDHDLVHELSKRLDALWRYDQYIANAASRPEIQEFWRKLKAEDQENVDQLKGLVRDEIGKDCF